jgi:hypothetical protein
MKHGIKNCVLDEGDLAAIERLSGERLDADIKGYLMREYGKGGRLEQVIDHIGLCELSDSDACGDCMLCCYPSEDPILEQITLSIACHRRGRLKYHDDNYHSVLARCCIAWKDEVRLPYGYIPF